jgi:CheY-like chemotaxis protein
VRLEVASEAVKWKILVVDDDAEMRGLVAKSIRLEVPCTTTEAGSAKEATSLLKEVSRCDLRSFDGRQRSRHSSFFKK